MALVDIAALQVTTQAGAQAAVTNAPIVALASNPVNITGTTSGIPTIPGDQIYLTTFSNQPNGSLVVVGRATNASGQAFTFTQTFPMPGSYTPYGFYVPMPGGTLQSLAAFFSIGLPALSWCYATAGIVNPATGLSTPYFNLFGDYVSQAAGASWPGRGVIPPEQVDALSYTLRTNDFGAGNGWGVVCPDLVQWDVHWLAVNLVTSSAAGNRYLSAGAGLWAQAGQIVSWQDTISTPIPASTTVTGVWDGYGNDYQNGGALVRGLWPRRMILHGNDALGNVVLPFDSGDIYEWATVQITERYTPNADANPE